MMVHMIQGPQSRYGKIDFFIDQARIIILIVLQFTGDVILGPSSSISRIMIISLSMVVSLEFAYWGVSWLIKIAKFGVDIVKMVAFLG
jgi:hypothetical protein